jgi:hypothetical protein
MSIKSQTPGIASDLPLIEKQRQPNYLMGKKSRNSKIPNNWVNNISRYVKINLKQVAKPRNKEYR